MKAESNVVPHAIHGEHQWDGETNMKQLYRISSIHSKGRHAAPHPSPRQWKVREWNNQHRKHPEPESKFTLDRVGTLQNNNVFEQGQWTMVQDTPATQAPCVTLTNIEIQMDWPNIEIHISPSSHGPQLQYIWANCGELPFERFNPVALQREVFVQGENHENRDGRQWRVPSGTNRIWRWTKRKQ